MSFGFTLRCSCPFCDWFMDETSESVGGAGSPADAYRVWDHHAANVDAILQAHLDTHVDEMVATARPPG